MTGSSRIRPCASGDQASVAIPCDSPYVRTSVFWKAGCSSIWFTAGTTSLVAASRSRWSISKFETPIERIRPSRWNSTSTCQVSSYGAPSSLGIGQWIRNRSTYSNPSSESVVSNALRASSGRWAALLSLLVTYTSARSRPAARTASPTPRSLRYISAVSMCR